MAFSIRSASCLFLCSSALLLAACDEQSSPSEPDQVHRAKKKFTYYAGKKSSGTLSGAGNGDIFPNLPFPLPDIFLEGLHGNLNAFFANLWLATEEPHDLCAAGCAEAGHDWDGGVFAEGEYVFGEVEVFENDAGEVSSQLDIEYEVHYGCECAG